MTNVDDGKKKSGLARFQAVNTDPRFKRQKKKASKLQVDSRFKGMFTETDFVHPVKIDKYGRKTRSSEDLKRFYKVEGEDSEVDTVISDSKEESGEGSDVDHVNTDSSGSDSSDDELTKEVMAAHPLVLQNSAPLGEPSSRLALVNMDWDQVKAVDILAFAAAFKPPTGVIHSVKIYPSEFGKERMRKEALVGPDIGKGVHSSIDGNDNEELTEEKQEMMLRKYQLERLRYYYAVIDCDSVHTASMIYTACDGREFEQSGNILDLRYVPDGESFCEDEVSDASYPNSLDPTKYKAKPDMATAALQSSSVTLTWDQDDPDRVRMTKSLNELSLSRAQRRKIDVRDVDLAAYLASASSSEGEDAPEEDLEEYRRRLLTKSVNPFERKSRDADLDISFKAAFANCEDDFNGDVHAEGTFEMQAGGKDSADITSDEELTVFERERERMKRKKAERKAKRKAERDLEINKQAATAEELECLLKTSKYTVNDSDDEYSFGLKRDKKKKNKKTKTETSQKVDTRDARFKAIYDQPEFAIDPSNPAFKRTPGMQALLEERVRVSVGDQESRK